MALVQNSQVSVLKLGYNNLGDTGVELLAPAIADHDSLESLDLGFNNFGDEGAKRLLDAIPADGRIWTLYLAGNLMGEDGAMSIADMIRRGCCIRELYLTGNRLGPAGVKAIAQAIVEEEAEKHLLSVDMMEDNPAAVVGPSSVANTETSSNRAFVGMQELFLGGTGMGSAGCEAVAQLLEKTVSLRTLSMPNCDINDEALAMVASSIKKHRGHLPLERLQLSFNKITCRGMESLSNAIWGSSTLSELLLDNNEISDTGVQLIATVIPYVRSLETLDVGFNKIKSPGIKLLMKAVAESRSLKHLSLSGNNVDTTSAKFVAYAMAHSSSLIAVSLDHCSIMAEGQRQIVAGIVSNRKTALRKFRGFDIGPVIVTLGFPPAMEHWNNEHVLNFVHLMWEKANLDDYVSNEEKTIDPLHFLPNGSSNGSSHQSERVQPIEAHIVVEVAKKAFASLVEDGFDVFTRRFNSDAPASPLAATGIIYEDQVVLQETNTPSESSREPMPTRQNRSFVAPPEESAKHSLTDPSRKKRIVEWLCSNIQHLNKLAQKPFSSAELWKLHQHYFTPVVCETGGSIAPSPSPSANSVGFAVSSVPEVSRATSTDHPGDMLSDSTEESLNVPVSDPSLKASSPLALSSLPMLKRKVSYRFLADAASLATSPRLDFRNARLSHNNAVSLMIEGGPTGHSMPPKTKRPRRNRTRISFLPRVKAKLDSFLDVCHEKALVTMRQLYYVEQAILSGQVNPIDPTTTSRTHLCGDCATDAEMIVVDMI